MVKQNLLIIFEDTALIEQLREFFKDYFNVEYATDGVSGMVKAIQTKPDVLLIGYQLPKLTSLEICQQIRQYSHSPILILANELNADERINCYESGADGIIVAPFNFKEIYYNIQVHLRRTVQTSNHNEPNMLVYGNLVMNRLTHKVYIREEEVRLTRKEFFILWVLASKHNEVVSRNELIRVIWGYDHVDDDRMIDTHLNRLRKKLQKYNQEFVITTIWGLGYKIEKASKKPSLKQTSLQRNETVTLDM